jgi:dihydrolipoamide dehydrogenase
MTLCLPRQNIMRMEHTEIDYRCVRACVLTYTKVAFVGELSGRPGEFPSTASAQVNWLGDTMGLVKVFERNGKLVGCYIIGSLAGEIIVGSTIATKMGIGIDDLFDTIHPHPTLAESLAN